MICGPCIVVVPWVCKKRPEKYTEKIKPYRANFCFLPTQKRTTDTSLIGLQRFSSIQTPLKLFAHKLRTCQSMRYTPVYMLTVHMCPCCPFLPLIYSFIIHVRIVTVMTFTRMGVCPSFEHSSPWHRQKSVQLKPKQHNDICDDHCTRHPCNKNESGL